MSHTEFQATFMLYLHTKFSMLSFSGSLLITTKPTAKHIFLEKNKIKSLRVLHTHARVLLYHISLRNYQEED